jgi:hypothetical protein
MLSLKCAKFRPTNFRTLTLPKGLSVMFSAGACYEAENYEQSQILIICIETLRPREL